MIPLRDEFLSEEDLDLAALSMTELLAWWDLWLLQAQASNDIDEHLYSHGVFLTEPGDNQADAGGGKDARQQAATG